jgi:hypothetical protein
MEKSKRQTAKKQRSRFLPFVLFNAFQSDIFPSAFYPDLKPFRVHHLYRRFNANRNASEKPVARRKHHEEGVFCNGKMGDLGGVLFIGGIEHAVAGFPGVAVDLVERGEVPLVRWRKNRVAATVAGARGLSCRFGIDTLGGAINLI